VWIGSGFESPGSVIQGTLTFQAGSSGTVFEGFRVESSAHTVTLGNSGNITFRRCRIESTHPSSGYHAVYRATASNSRLWIEDCILRTLSTHPNSRALLLNLDSLFVYNTVFSMNGATDMVAGPASSLAFTNSVFLNPYRVFNITGWCPLIMSNNLFYDWTASPAGFGTYPNLGTWEYNSSSSVAAPGTGALNLTVNPFVVYSEASNYQPGVSDLHLHPVNGASSIDSGSPAMTDLLDGSPCDRGLYGGRRPFVDTGIPAYPFVTTLTVPGAAIAGQPLSITATGRVGREN